MFFEDFFGLNPAPSMYSNWAPRRAQQFPAQPYADYSPYYGYASPHSSRRPPRSTDYYPFQSPAQAEVQSCREIPIKTSTSSARRPVGRDDRTEEEPASTCDGCPEYGGKNVNRRLAARPGLGKVQANDRYRPYQEDIESSSEEEEDMRFIPSMSQRQTQKNSVELPIIRTDSGRRPIVTSSPASKKLDSSPVADNEKISPPFAVSQNKNCPQPINVKKSAEAEDVKESASEMTAERTLPVPKEKTSTEILSEIKSETEALDTRVRAFTGTDKNREYIVIDELLTKILLRLDAVESGGDEEVRNARRSLVKQVQSLVNQLELKVGIVKMEGVHEESVSDEVELQDSFIAEDTSVPELNDEAAAGQVEDTNVPEQNDESAAGQIRVSSMDSFIAEDTSMPELSDEAAARQVEDTSVPELNDESAAGQIRVSSMELQDSFIAEDTVPELNDEAAAGQVCVSSIEKENVEMDEVTAS